MISNYGTITGIGILVTGFLLVAVTLPIHEKLHQLVFNRNGYDSEIRYRYSPPHVLAEEQHIDSDTWERMELAPLLALGICFSLFTPTVVAILGYGITEILVFSLLVLAIHVLSCFKDIWLYLSFKRNYCNDATAFMFDTADDKSEKYPVKIYFCPAQPGSG